MPSRARAWLVPVIAASAWSLAALAPVAGDQTPAPPPFVRPALAAVLTQHLHFSKSDFAALGRGAVVAKSLQPGDDREVAVAGAVRVEIPVNYYLARVRDIVTFKISHDVFQVGVFKTPAAAADLAPLVLEKGDIEDVRHCVLARCQMRLDATAIDRFKREVIWSGGAAGDQVHRVARDVLAGYVAAYQRGGNAALVEYRDTARPVRVAEQTRLLVKRSPYLDQVSPGLRAHLENYPRVPAPEAEDILYWSKETFGMKPVVTATHLVIWRGPNAVADAYVASKQVYSTHYFDASLGITLAAAIDGPDRPGMVFVYVSRSLVDALDGGILGPIKRTIARSKARGGLEDHLAALKTRMERDFQKK